MSLYPSVRLLLCAAGGVMLGKNFPAIVESAFYSVLLFGSIVIGALSYERFFRQKNASSLWAFAYPFLIASFYAFYTAEEAGKLPSDTVLQYVNESVELIGTVETKSVVRHQRAQWTMSAEKLIRDQDTLTVSGKVSVKLSGANETMPSFLPEDKVWVSGKLQIPPGPRNKGDFDLRELLARKKIHSVLTTFGTWNVEKIRNENPSFFKTGIVRPIYTYIDHTIDTLIVGEDERAFLKGVILGDRAAIQDEINAAFQATGTIHVLSISGFHVGLLVVLLSSLLKRTKVITVGRWIAFFLTGIILLIYSNVTGNSPPVKRAAIMAVVFAGTEIFERKAYPLNTLAFADLIILTMEPLDLFDLSFILTNAAVGATILLYPKLLRLDTFSKQFSSKSAFKKSLAGALRFLWESLALTITATVGVAPFIAYYFGKVALLGLLANIPVVLLVSFAMCVMVPALLFNFLSATLAGYYAAFANVLISFSIKIVVWFSAIPFAAIPLKLNLFSVVAYFIVIISLLALPGPRHRGMRVIVILIVLNVFVWKSILTPNEPLAKIAINDIGQGRAIIFRTNSETILIDAGVRKSQFSRIDRQL
ncbi:MAG: DUF4131 domain-containing protein, partial [Chlorobiales bacterium]|nr:DUF4131 domain-containing protein [Chlorobiales bacterium]